MIWGVIPGGGPPAEPDATGGGFLLAAGFFARRVVAGSASSRPSSSSASSLRLGATIWLSALALPVTRSVTGLGTQRVGRRQRARGGRTALAGGLSPRGLPSALLLKPGHAGDVIDQY